MQAFQSDGGRGTTKGLSTAAGHPGSARAGIRDAQIDLGNLCVLLPGADVGPWPTDTESPVYADLIHDTAREAVGELFRRLHLIRFYPGQSPRRVIVLSGRRL